MKKISLLMVLATLCITNTGYSRNPSNYRTYRLPNEEVIRNCMCDLGMDYFDEKTDYSRKNANQKRYAQGLHNGMIQSFYDFAKYLKRDMTPQQVVMILWGTTVQEASLYKCMLGDEDGEQAVAELKEANIDIESNEQQIDIAREITQMVWQFEK